MKKTADIKKKLQVLDTEFDKTQAALDKLVTDLEDFKILKRSNDRKQIIDTLLPTLTD